MTRARQDILQVVAQARGIIGPTAVARTLGKKQGTVTKLMFKMWRQGQLQKTGYGRYLPTPDQST